MASAATARRRSPIHQRVAVVVLAALGAFYIWLVLRTTRWTVLGRTQAEAEAAKPRGMIAIVWHGRGFLSPTYAPASKRTVAMISQSVDGNIMAAIARHWGVHAVRGSTSDRRKGRNKGGAGAFIDALHELTEHNAMVAISPDGPRGPRMRAHPGAARLACKAGVSVVAVGFSVRRGRLLGSWDRYLLPFPFGRGAIVYSEPRAAPADQSAETVERFRAELEADLNAVTAEADRLCDRTPVTPAEVG